MPHIRPVVCIDSNMLTWMPPDIFVNPTPKVFNLQDERCAYEALRQMRQEGIITIFAWDKAIDDLMAHRGPAVTDKVLDYFSYRISRSSTYVIGDQEHAMVERAYGILSNSREKQDDAEFFVMTYIVRAEVSHVATCDCKFHNKWIQYLHLLKLRQDVELTMYVESLRRGKPYFVGFPSKVLEDVERQIE